MDSGSEGGFVVAEGFETAARADTARISFLLQEGQLPNRRASMTRADVTAGS